MFLFLNPHCDKVNEATSVKELPQEIAVRQRIIDVILNFYMKVRAAVQ